MTARRPPTAKARRAGLLRAAMVRMLRARGRFRGALLMRLAQAVGRARPVVRPFQRRHRAVFGANFLLPLNALSDLGLGQSGGGGGGPGRG